MNPSLAADSDSQLMLDYGTGNAEAFELLYNRYKQPLYKFIRNSCSCELQSAELFQDVWLRVIKARSSYTPDTTFKAWLFRIARNRTVDYYRLNGRLNEATLNEEIPIESANDQAVEPEAYASLSEQIDALQQALETLPLAQREALLLHYIAGMTVKEIADVVSAKPETVKSRIRYATSRVRAQLRGAS
jgi:RNA polymerase sigma-70 factor (ECF subfamily)